MGPPDTSGKRLFPREDGLPRGPLWMNFSPIHTTSAERVAAWWGTCQPPQHSLNSMPVVSHPIVIYADNIRSLSPVNNEESRGGSGTWKETQFQLVRRKLQGSLIIHSLNSCCGESPSSGHCTRCQLFKDEKSWMSSLTVNSKSKGENQECDTWQWWGAQGRKVQDQAKRSLKLQRKDKPGNQSIDSYNTKLNWDLVTRKGIQGRHLFSREKPRRSVKM